MKKSTRGFVVERRHSKKTPLWSAADLGSAETQRTSSALREANELFRPKALVATDAPGAPAIRVLPDLSEKPVADAGPTPVVAEAAPRRPRGRPRKTVATTAEAPDLWSFRDDPDEDNRAASMAPVMASSAVDGDDSSAPRPSDHGAAAAATVAEAIIHVQTPDEIIAAVRDKVERRTSRKRRFRTAADLPVGQRWKRRLHPAAW